MIFVFPIWKDVLCVYKFRANYLTGTIRLEFVHAFPADPAGDPARLRQKAATPAPVVAQEQPSSLMAQPVAGAASPAGALGPFFP